MVGRKLLLVGTLAFVAATGSPLGAAEVPAAAPGDSVVGLGKFPGAPELYIHDSGGNDVVLLGEGQFPTAYGGSVGAFDVSNACLGSAGFADVGSGDYTFPTKKHDYAFTFADGVAVSSFSVMLLDWGDFLPYGAAPGCVCSVSMTAFDAGGVVVAVQKKSFTTCEATRNRRTSTEFGSMDVAGDACTAAEGQPGRCPLAVAGAGIVRVEVAFDNTPSIDPHVALVAPRYWIRRGIGDARYWLQQDPWPVSSVEVGGVSHTRAQAAAVLALDGGLDQSYVLAKQLIAAKLNVADGNDASCVADAIAAADAWFAAHPVGSDVRPSSAAWKNEGHDLEKTLQKYNDGKRCGE